MTTTVFTDKQTLIQASWLNDVDGATYKGTGVYTPGGTGSVPTTVQSKLRESVSVLDYGVDPTSGLDQTDKIQAAI